jgi:hypothetical protein
MLQRRAVPVPCAPSACSPTARVCHHHRCIPAAYRAVCGMRRIQAAASRGHAAQAQTMMTLHCVLCLDPYVEGRRVFLAPGRPVEPSHTISRGSHCPRVRADAAPHSQAAKEAAGKGPPPGKKAKMSQPVLVVGQSFLTNFLKAAPRKPADSVPSPQVLEAAKKESLQEFADRMAQGDGDGPGSKSVSTQKLKSKLSLSQKTKHGDRSTAAEAPPRKALDTLTSSQANSSTRGAGKVAPSQAPGGASGAAPEPSATEKCVPQPSTPAEHRQCASPGTAKQGAADQTLKTGEHHAPKHCKPACGPTDRSGAIEAPPAHDGPGDGVGDAAGKRAATEEGDSPATKSQRADTHSAEKSALSKLSPNSSSMQSLSSPHDRSGSGKEDISPSQTDIYGLFANDDEEELAIGHGTQSGTNGRKRARTAPAAPSSFIFAVPRPPSSIISEGDLAATLRPIMGSTYRGEVAPAQSLHAKSKKMSKKGSLRCCSVMSSEMRNLMSQLEKQASNGANDDTSSHSRTAALDSSGQLHSHDSPCTEKGPQTVLQNRRTSDLPSTPEGSSTAQTTPATLPMSQGEYSFARTAHLQRDTRSADATTVLSEAGASGPCVFVRACVRVCARECVSACKHLAERMPLRMETIYPGRTHRRPCVLQNDLLSHNCTEARAMALAYVLWYQVRFLKTLQIDHHVTLWAF